MSGRYKFQVWSDAQQRWRTAYCKPDMLASNCEWFSHYGFQTRWHPRPV